MPRCPADRRRFSRKRAVQLRLEEGHIEAVEPLSALSGLRRGLELRAEQLQRVHGALRLVEGHELHGLCKGQAVAVERAASGPGVEPQQLRLGAQESASRAPRRTFRPLACAGGPAAPPPPRRRGPPRRRLGPATPARPALRAWAARRRPGCRRAAGPPPSLRTRRRGRRTRAAARARTRPAGRGTGARASCSGRSGALSSWSCPAARGSRAARAAAPAGQAPRSGGALRRAGRRTGAPAQAGAGQAL